MGEQTDDQERMAGVNLKGLSTIEVFYVARATAIFRWSGRHCFRDREEAGAIKFPRHALLEFELELRLVRARVSGANRGSRW